MQLEEIREKNDRERKDIKQKFMRQNFQSNAVEKALKGQETDQIDEKNRNFGYDDFGEVDYNDDDGFGNDSANYDAQEYDGLSEQNPDSPVKPGYSASSPYQEDTNINSIPDDELEAALNHYKAMLRKNRVTINKLEQDIETAGKKNGRPEEGSKAVYDDDAASQDTPFNVSDIEEVSDNENSDFFQKNQNQRSMGYFFENKIKDFEMRCVNGLGEQIFQQAYNFIKSKQGLTAEELRPYVTGKVF